MPEKTHATARVSKSTGVRSRNDLLTRSTNESLKTATQTISVLKAKLADFESRSDIFGFNLPSLRDALCQDFQAGSRHWTHGGVKTMGEGPWQEADFDRFLRRRQFKPVKSPRRSVRRLIVGMSGWSDDVLSQQLLGKNTHTLRIYTQEIFVFGIILGRDPYDVLEQGVVEEVADCHPAIQFILQKGFSWPWVLEEDKPVAKIVRALTPSVALAAVVGPNPLSRADAVSRLWKYIQKHKLRDAVNKRMIDADEKLTEVFGKPQVSMFEMAGLIGRHLK